MASSKDYLEYILDQLSGLDDISYRAMMGERPDQSDYTEELDREACLKLYDEYRQMDKVIY